MPVQVGSSQTLLADLKRIASELRIKLRRDEIPASVVSKLNRCKPLDEQDDDSLTELRSAWFVLHEGAKLSIEYNVALLLSG